MWEESTSEQAVPSPTLHMLSAKPFCCGGGLLDEDDLDDDDDDDWMETTPYGLDWRHFERNLSNGCFVGMCAHLL